MSSMTELLHLIARWVHLIAGIMWIGNSMLFNWLDRNLVMPDDPEKGLIGENWMIHSGGFYQVKKLNPEPGALPKMLHWFKWQNGVTWLSGISLLVLVYYMGGAALMTDAAVSRITGGSAVLLGLGCVAASWVLYDLLWRSPLGKRQTLSFLLSIAIVLGLSAVLFHYLSGRAAYMHVGVMLGTLMTGNVWMVIIPSQRELVDATREHRKQNLAKGYQAKARSIHNNYMTFPLLFIMISNHFPLTFGHALNWAVLLVLAFGSALIRHFMNIRFTWRNWFLPTTLVFFATCVATLIFFSYPAGFGRQESSPTGPQRWADIEPIIQSRCVPCHATRPTNAAVTVAPSGIIFERYSQVSQWKERIKLRVVSLRNMPLNNATNITDEERARIGAWIDQGARED
ncbi:MAG: urate hydroxylase PuuD [Deltaproteobacteria bacterium]|nr:urate hydroxylase PuuD [Deltaproteobacteria bacterium]